MPRRPTHSVGRPGANSSVSETSAKSAFRSAGLEATYFGNSLPADFFFAFEKHAHVQGQLAVGGQQRLQRLDLRPHLALVVDRAARVEVAVALGGLEGRREPLVERIGGLHIVVAVEEHGGLAGGVQPVGVDQRMAVGFNQPDILHADAGQFGGQQLGGAGGNRPCARAAWRPKECAAGP